MSRNTIYLVSDYDGDRRWKQQASFDDAISYLRSLTTVFLDTETTGMEFIINDMHCLQAGDLERQYVFDWSMVMADPDKLKALQQLVDKPKMPRAKGAAEESARLIVLHNAMFDLPFLYKYGIVPHRVYDTLLAEQCLSLGILGYGRSLADCLKRYCDIDMDKGQQEHIAERGLQDHNDVKYAGLDIKALAMIYEPQRERVVRMGHINQVLVKSQFTRVLSYIEYCGQYLDEDEFYMFVRDTECDEWNARRALIAYAKEHLADNGYSDGLNWESSQQVIPLLEAAGVDCTDPDDKGKKTTDLKKLAPQVSGNEFLKLYDNYSGLRKTVSTYGRSWLAARFSDKRIHTKYKPMVDTGRTSCGNIKNSQHWRNLQNVSNVPGLREVFKSQGNNVLVQADYSSQESVLFADQCKDDNLINFWLSGEGDMHSYTARLLWPERLGNLSLHEIKDRFPNDRKSAKSAGFSIQYGSEGFSISRALNVPDEVGKDIYERYMRAYPGMATYFRRVQDESFERGYILINDRTGGKRYIQNGALLRKWWPTYKRDRRQVPYEIRRVISGVARQCLNTPTQGTAADMSAEAGNSLFDWIVWEKKAFGKIKITNFIHDEYVTECHPNRAEEVSDRLKFFMEDAADQYTSILKIHATPVISRVWGH